MEQKTYNLYGSELTAAELRQGYRIITGLDNDNEFTDSEIYFYLCDALKE